MTKAPSEFRKARQTGITGCSQLGSRYSLEPEQSALRLVCIRKLQESSTTCFWDSAATVVLLLERHPISEGPRGSSALGRSGRRKVCAADPWGPALNNRPRSTVEKSQFRFYGHKEMPPCA
nr:uncharacterized protein LOC112428923 [Macaca nemestrina]